MLTELFHEPSRAGGVELLEFDHVLARDEEVASSIDHAVFEDVCEVVTFARSPASIDDPDFLRELFVHRFVSEDGADAALKGWVEARVPRAEKRAEDRPPGWDETTYGFKQVDDQTWEDVVSLGDGVVLRPSRSLATTEGCLLIRVGTYYTNQDYIDVVHDFAAELAPQVCP